jgi:hypothetical protein
VPICLQFPEFALETEVIGEVCRRQGVPGPRLVFPAPELLDQIDNVVRGLEAVEKAGLPPLVQRRCRFFLQEYILPELENFLNLAQAIAATARGSEEEADILRRFGVKVELGMIRRVGRAKSLSKADQEFLRGMNIIW